MGSNGSISTLAARWMPPVAIFRHELRILRTSWLVRLWLVVAFVVALVTMGAGWGQLQTALFVGTLLFPFLVVPWFLVVMMLGVTPMSGGRAEEMTDGILSRPITRYEYLLAAWAARVVLVLGVSLVVLVPAVLLVTLSERPVPDDSVTMYGVCTSVLVVGLVLVFQVSFGFLLGTLLRSTSLAMVVLLFVWLPVNFVLDAFSLETFSPISMNRAMPRLLRQPWRESGTDGPTAPDAKGVDSLGSWMDRFSAAFSVPEEKPDPDFFQRKGYDDFSLAWVLLGYATATAASIGLATAGFCLRDL